MFCKSVGLEMWSGAFGPVSELVNFRKWNKIYRPLHPRRKFFEIVIAYYMDTCDVG